MSINKSILVNTGKTILEADLSVPDNSDALVLFAHGSGSSRHSHRNKRVAAYLNKCGIATLLLDLLSVEEEDLDRYTGNIRFDLELLAERIECTKKWLAEQDETAKLKVAYFGSSTGAGAAILAAARSPENLFSVVSRGGRPDLAEDELFNLKVPVLFIVGEDDPSLIELNQKALEKIKSEKRMIVVPGASHLFEEEGKLEVVAELAKDWFEKHLTAKTYSLKNDSFLI